MKQSKSGSLSNAWKGGLPNCATCFKKLSRRDAKYCCACKGVAISKSKTGKKTSANTIRKLVIAHTGKKHSKETRIKMSKKHLEIRELNHLWRGGITPINHKIRNSVEYRIWRDSVFIRDNYSCVFCKKRGGNLNADHIKPFAYFPELRFEISNGRTLCVPCHKKTPSYMNRFFKVDNVPKMV